MSRKLQVAAEKAIARSMRTEPQRWSVEESFNSAQMRREDGLSVHFDDLVLGPVRICIFAENECFRAIKGGMLYAAHYDFMRPIWQERRNRRETALSNLAFAAETEEP